MGGLFGGSSGGQSTSETPLSGIDIQSSANGLPIPLVYGTTRVTPNLLWYGDFTAISHTTSQSSGGGKGGGGSSPTNTSYTYNASFALAICEGPINAITNAWIDKAQVNPSSLFSLYLGTYPQTPWPYLTTNHPGEDVGYPGISYAAAGGYDFGTSSNIPNHNFEVQGKFLLGGGVLDADPKDIVTDLLTNAATGVPNAPVLSGLTQFSNYCRASGLLLSPCYDTATDAASMLTDLFKLTNTGAYFSEGVLKLVPCGDATVTGNGATFTPSLTPVANFTDDDYLGDAGSDPVTIKRNSIAETISTSSDAYNQVSVEFLNRLNSYQAEIVTVQDQVSIDTYGLRPMDTVTAHQIADANVAGAIAQLLLQRSVYIRSQYEFKLGWQWCHLEPTDLVTLNESTLGLVNYPVRILKIEEDDAGTLTVLAEDAPIGVSSHVVASVPQGGGYNVDCNAAPGNVSAVAIFEPPMSKTEGTGLAVWAGVSGPVASTVWGGCNVWVSYDGDTYKMLTTINSPARVGHITASIDNVTTGPLGVHLDGMGGQMLSASAADAEALNSLFYVGGANPEFMAYQGAALTGENAYSLTGLVRGAYGSAAAAHTINDPFVRVDDALVKSGSLDLTLIGKLIHFKFQSFNIWGSGIQELADIPDYSYTITGGAFKSSLNNVQNLISVFRGGLTLLSWDAVTDPVRTIDYEVRKGATWAAAQVLGRTPSTEFTADGDGVYWVAAHSDLAYSGIPTEIIIAGASIVKNVVASVDEQATGWGGSVSGAAKVSGATIALGATALFSTIPLVSAVKSVAYFGGVGASGIYTIPVAHEVDVGTVQPCNCSVSYQSRAKTPFALFSKIPLVSAVASVAGNFAGMSDVRIQIATSDLAGTYGTWRDFIPGTYVGRKFKFRALLTSADPSISAVLDNFAFTVDVPDRNDKGNAIALPSAGSTIFYATPFQVAPNVQITIINAQQGDDVQMPPPTAFGFTVQIVNGGVGVARNINWLAQGY